MVQDQVNVHGKNSSSLQWQSSQEDSFLGKFFVWQSWVGGWCVGDWQLLSKAQQIGPPKASLICPLFTPQ
jgi:hypothetical protein